jgi:DNA-binding transcriptional MerR regulator
MDVLYEVHDVVKLSGSSAKAVRDWTSKGLLPLTAITPRGLRLYKRADVDVFLARRAAGCSLHPAAWRAPLLAADEEPEGGQAND